MSLKKFLYCGLYGYWIIVLEEFVVTMVKCKRIISFFFVLCFFVTIFSGCQNSQGADNNSAIWETIKPSVVEGLRDPDSAEFCSIDEAIFKRLDADNKVQVIGYLKGSNAFGNTVREGFIVIVTYDEAKKEYSVGKVEYVDYSEYELRLKLNTQLEDRISGDDKILTETELEEVLASQDLSITGVYVTPKEDLYFAHGDMLQVILKNNTGETVRDVVVAFAAWDKNGIPIRIKGSISIYDGKYVTFANYDGVNLLDGQTIGEDSGFYVDEDLNIVEVKAIIVSYELLDGTIWENPNLIDFYELYENVPR